MTKPQFILGCGADEAEAAAALGCESACLCYRISASGKLLCAAPRAPQGGIMALCASGEDAPDERELIPALERQLKKGRHGGLFADFEDWTPRLGALMEPLERTCRALGCDFFVPQLYAPQTQSACVLVGSDVAAGSYEGMISEQAQRYGERFALELVPLRADFILPSGGRARQIDGEELDMLLARGLTPYFSEALCARYFTYRDGAGRTHFTLFDDASTLKRKCDIAARFGARYIFGLYGELVEALPDILTPSGAY